MATITSNGTGGGLWHDGSSWDGGVVPAIDDTVIVDVDDTIELDGDCECGDGTYVSNARPDMQTANFRLLLKGTIKASRTVDSSLAVKGVIGADVESGWDSTLDFGTEADPIDTVNFTWHMNRSGFTSQGYFFGTGFYSRSSTRMAKIYMRSAHHRIRNVYLTEDVSAGESIIKLNDTTGWVAGDELVLVPKWTTSTSNPYDNHDYDFVTIDSISGNDVTLTAGLIYDHGYTDPEDLEMGAVTNRTSNVKLTGDGDDRIFPAIYLSRGIIEFKDVVGEYMNNRYSINSSCLRFNNMHYFDNSEVLMESCVFESDFSNFDDNSEDILYFYSPYHNFNQEVNITDIMISHTNKGSYISGGSFRNYYGGRSVILTNCNTYHYSNRNATCFSNYQQPATYNNCKSFNGYWGFQLHDNVDTDTNGCWVIGCTYGFNTYNGTAIYNDLHIRFVKFIGMFVSGWRGKAIANRLDFKDFHVYNNNEKDYIQTPDGLPDGNLYTLTDIKNDSNKQHWYYSYGQKWWDDVNVRTDPHSIGISSTSDVYNVPHTRSFYAQSGDHMACGLSIKNLSPTYIGFVTLTILQGSNIIVTESFDVSTFIVDEWSAISVSGVAVKTMETTFKIEYRGTDGKISITDFIQPFSINEKSQAQAVWAELANDNKFSGSMGEYMNNIQLWAGWLRSLL